MLLKTIKKINEAGTIRLAESLARCHYKDEADAERDFELFNEGAKQMSNQACVSQTLAKHSERR